MAELGDFQDAFMAALHDMTQLGRLGDAAVLGDGFAVYRNTIFKGASDALAANFPTVARLVGDAWFADCARAFAAQQLPQRAPLFDYGAQFAAFLDAFAPAAALPYLGDVARIDRWWIESHVAADAPPLAADALAGLSGEALFAQWLTPHPSLRLGWLATPAATIWCANRPPAPPRAIPDLDWVAEGVLLVRRDGAVTVQPVDAAMHAFVAGCRAQPLGAAAVAALTIDAGFDVGGQLAALLGMGAFAHAECEA